jgi:hypothetical protein
MRRPSTSKPSSNTARGSGRPSKASFLTPTLPVNNFYEEASCKTENISQVYGLPP